jgi:hypothetical protein
MANMKLKFEDFQIEELSKKQQMTVRGGDDAPDPPYEPGKGGSNGNGVVAETSRFSMVTPTLS